MLRLTHSIRNEIYLIVPKTELAILLRNFQPLVEGHTQILTMDVEADPKILKINGPNYLTTLRLSVGNEESLTAIGSILQLKLDQDSINHVYDLLLVVLEDDDVMPEVTDIFLPAWKKEKGFAIIVEN